MAVWMASVEMCGRNPNLKSSCDDLFGAVEDTRAITIMWICDKYGFVLEKNMLW